MPVIASQHAWKDADHRPMADWPDDCLVQWGRQGLVFDRRGGARTTAFFEAFPADGGFIRGEGPDLAAAERAALGQFLRERACAHAWRRGAYRNGAGTCARCGAFRASLFPGIRPLDAWRRPLDAMELETIASGALQPAPWWDSGSRRHHRRLWLRARLAGIDLPAQPDRVHDGEPDAAWREACRRAVARHVAASPPGPSSREGLAGVFDRLAERGLAEELAARPLDEVLDREACDGDEAKSMTEVAERLDEMARRLERPSEGRPVDIDDVHDDPISAARLQASATDLDRLAARLDGAHDFGRRTPSP